MIIHLLKIFLNCYDNTNLSLSNIILLDMSGTFFRGLSISPIVSMNSDTAFSAYLYFLKSNVYFIFPLILIDSNIGFISFTQSFVSSSRCP
jgi:hypothetical protein